MSALGQKRTVIIFQSAWHVGLSKSHVHHRLALGGMPGNMPLATRILRGRQEAKQPSSQQ